MAANTLAPSGFQTLRRIDGTNPNYAMREMTLAYNYATRINYGDPVILSSSGTVQLYVQGTNTTVLGIFRGCRYLDPNSGKTEYYAAWKTPTLVSTSVVYAMVDADPFTSLACQVNGTALDQTAIGKNIDISSGTAGSTASNSPYSVCSLSGASAATTNTLPFRILGIIGLQGTLAQANATPAIYPGYTPTNDNQWLEVFPVRHDFLQLTGQQT